MSIVHLDTKRHSKSYSVWGDLVADTSKRSRLKLNDTVEVGGKLTPEDRGGGIYKVVDSEPSHTLKLETVTGSGLWLEFVGREVTPAMFKEVLHTDDTASIQAALDHFVEGTNTLVKDEIGVIYMPRKSNRYQVSSTLKMGYYSSGLKIYTDVSYNNSQLVLGEKALIDWTGNEEIVFQISTVSLHLNIVGISINGLTTGSRATIGFSTGNWVSTTKCSLKFATFDRCTVSNTRIGFALGNSVSNLGADQAVINLNMCSVNDCLDAGVFGASGNLGSCVITQGVYKSNGTAPTTDVLNPTGIGANILFSAGSLNMISVVTSGGGTPTSLIPPADSDIYFAGHALNITDHWADTHGIWLFQRGNTRQLSVNGCRHYDGTMNDTNTPTSIDCSDSLMITGGMLFGDIVNNGGHGNSVTTIGMEFWTTNIGTSRPTLGIGKIKGTAVQGNLSGALQISPRTIYDTGNPKIIFGTSERPDNDSRIASNHYIQLFQNLRPNVTSRVVAGSGVNDSGFSERLNRTNGAMQIGINCVPAILPSLTGWRAIIPNIPSYIYSFGESSTDLLKVYSHTFINNDLLELANFDVVLSNVAEPFDHSKIWVVSDTANRDALTGNYEGRRVVTVAPDVIEIWDGAAFQTYTGTISYDNEYMVVAGDLSSAAAIAHVDPKITGNGELDVTYSDEPVTKTADFTAVDGARYLVDVTANAPISNLVATLPAAGGEDIIVVDDKGETDSTKTITISGLINGLPGNTRVIKGKNADSENQGWRFKWVGGDFGWAGSEL